MVSEVVIKIVFFGLIILAVSLEVVGDILFKKWTIETKNILLISGLMIYFVGTIFWAFSLKYDYLSRAVSVFTILNLIVVVLVGVVMFNENLSLLNKIGVLLGIVSIVLLQI
jgi:multidrug transporter EmrE-like cation transporter